MTSHPIPSFKLCAGARRAAGALTAALLIAAGAEAQTLSAVPEPADGKYCSATAGLLYGACKSASAADAIVMQAKCLNISDAEERGKCQTKTAKEYAEATEQCRAQLGSRRGGCKILGEGRYDPSFDPSLFDHDFGNLTKPNPYYPIRIGNRWEYASASERDIVEIVNETKAIAGLTCLVRRDTSYDGKKLVEAADDWIAAKLDGSVWYCGEQVSNYETFKGDRPRKPELVNTDGSFKHGRERDKGGMLMPAQPAVGQVYYEEYALANAEDGAEVLSVDYAYGKDPRLDQLVPAALVQRLCSSQDCVVTRNFNLMEPGVLELKYYARGIGFFLETKPLEGEVLQLVNCNFDDRCNGLPAR